MSKRLITSLNNVYDCKFGKCNKKYSDTYIKSVMTQLKNNLNSLDDTNKKKANRLLQGSQKTETKKEVKIEKKKKVETNNETDLYSFLDGLDDEPKPKPKTPIKKKETKPIKLPKGKGKVESIPTPPMSKNIIKEEILLIKDKPKTQKRGRPRRELGSTKKLTKEREPEKNPKSIQVQNVPISQLKPPTTKPRGLKGLLEKYPPKTKPRGLKGLAESKQPATIEEVNKLIDSNINMVERLKKNMTMREVEKEFLKELLKKVNSKKNYTKEEKVKIMNILKKKVKVKVKEAFESLPNFLDEL